MSVYRTPTEYAITNLTPVRIASRQDAPIRIINIGVLGTVWLSENAGIKIGQGTPLNPGTSFTWLRDTEIFAVADISDPVRIIVTEEVDDWQPDPAAIAAAVLNAGVLVIDKPETLTTDTLNASNGFTTGRFDVSRFQSLSLLLTTTALSGGVNDYVLLDFARTATSSPILRRAIEFVNNSPSGGTWVANLPISTAFFEISSPSNTEVQTVVIASHRPQESIEQGVQTAVINQLPFTWYRRNIGTIAANTGFATPFFGPWLGQVEVMANCLTDNIAGSRVEFQQRQIDTGVMEIFGRLPAFSSADSGAGRAFVTKDYFALSGECFRIVIEAGVADLTNTFLNVKPASGYGLVA